MPFGYLSVDAYVKRNSVTLDAWVLSGRHKHHRERDHFGADSDLYIGIDEPLGGWGAGTPVKFILADLYERFVRLASYAHYIRVFSANAWVLAYSTDSAPVVPGEGRGIKSLDAWVFRNMTGSFTVSSLVGHGSIFTMNAWVFGFREITVNAWVV